ncbi:FABP family protein [Klenkia sp. LSe6-5]|uniref:Ferric nitrobindin-like protein n=1 Tax=Klenkia sesuvii TaxID=3103137 RepID=A0ABU8DQB8_9ACTN
MTNPTPAGLPEQPADGRTVLPVEETTDVRTGPEVAHELLSVLPLLGEWHGEGVLVGPDGDQRFGQWVRFAHDGRDFLAYESHTWQITAEGAVGAPDVRESGFWRPRGEDDVELLVAHPEGLVEIYVGTARTTTSWELTSDVLARTPDHPDTTKAVRLYGVVDGALMYAVDRAGPDGQLRPVMSARLERIR